MQYEGYARSDQTNTNGTPPLQTAAANMNAQAALQHIVLTYDPVNGQKLYVNGKFTGDVDPKKGGSLANWDDTFALVLGNEVDRQPTVAGRHQVRGHPQPRADGRADPAELRRRRRRALLHAVRRERPVGRAAVVHRCDGAACYDSYSYLFTNPTFISLDPNAAPGNIPVKGMRIGVNGVIGLPGQSYATLNATIGGSNYTAASGQLLSSVGAVVAAPTRARTPTSSSCRSTSSARPRTCSPSRPGRAAADGQPAVAGHGHAQLRGDQRDDVDDHGRADDGYRGRTRSTTRCSSRCRRCRRSMRSCRLAADRDLAARGAYCSELVGNQQLPRCVLRYRTGREPHGHCGRRSSAPAASRQPQHRDQCARRARGRHGRQPASSTAVRRPSSMRC